MKTLLIVYHTQSGTCARLAGAARSAAAAEEGIDVLLRRAWDADTADLAGADGVLLVAAENAGTLSGAMKDFLDRTLYPAIARGIVMPYALLVSAGNDGRGATAQARRILSGYPLVEAAEPVILRGEFGEAHATAAAELGRGFAAGLVMGIF
jgi:multimeric flavodoxin WrbA